MNHSSSGENIFLMMDKKLTRQHNYSTAIDEAMSKGKSHSGFPLFESFSFLELSATHIQLIQSITANQLPTYLQSKI